MREEEPPHGAKGTTTEPFDGGAFTFEVLAHAGKGVIGGAASESLRISLSLSIAVGDEQRTGKRKGRDSRRGG